jgi:hypothetical protein
MIRKASCCPKVSFVNETFNQSTNIVVNDNSFEFPKEVKGLKFQINLKVDKEHKEYGK